MHLELLGTGESHHGCTDESSGAAAGIFLVNWSLTSKNPAEQRGGHNPSTADRVQACTNDFHWLISISDRIQFNDGHTRDQ